MTRLHRTLSGSVAAFALGGLTVSGVQYAAAQDRDAAQDQGPKLMRPDPAYVQQLSFADLVEDVSPAVVSVRTTQVVEGAAGTGLPPEFERLFPQLRGRGGDLGPRELQGEGSGFFIDDQGHIVTNNHVIDGATEIVVGLNDGTELTAELVGTDPLTDIAVLKVEPTAKQRYVQFSTDTDLRVGDYVLAVGNPFGLGGTVTSGIVSAIGGDGRSGQYADFIQIDASINRGNSGGPTFDLRGNVVGVNTAIISPTGGNVGIGLAVPADTAATVTRQIIDEGGVTRGWLGVAMDEVDPFLARAVGLDAPTGVLVQSVQPDSPAQGAGIEDGDVILSFDGKEIDSPTTLSRVVGSARPGKRYPVTVLRDGERKAIDVELERREEVTLARGFGTSPSQEDDSLAEDLGVTFAPLTDDVRRRLGLEQGVTGVLVTDVTRESEANEAGIRAGMVITEADNREVKAVRDVERAVEMARERGKGAVLVRVVTPQGPDFRALPVAKG